ncbi:MAG: HAD family hydrolase [Phycisphaerae bacterium]
MGIEAVIFDLDGVLVDSAQAHHRSWQALGAELGCEVTAEQFAATFGRQNRDIVPLLFGEQTDPDGVQRLSDRKEQIYRDLIRGRVPAVPGAVELVGRCAGAGLSLAIGSSAPKENIDLVLSAMGIADFFEVVVHEGDVQRGKPDPQVFVLAAERLGVPAARCAVIEDAPSGIRAARAAGMIAVGLTSHHPAEALADAHLVVDRLEDLSPEVITGLA